MSGRGRGLTLPAWMTSGGGGGGVTAAAGSGIDNVKRIGANPNGAIEQNTGISQTRPPNAQQPVSAIWSQHTAPNGTPYYFNKTTGKSTFEKPLVRSLIYLCYKFMQYLT